MKLNKSENFLVPTDGYFISEEYAANLVTNHQAEVAKLNLIIENLKKKAKSDLSTESKKCDVKLSSLKSKLSSCDAAKRTQKDIYSDAIKRLSKQNDTPWYKSPLFTFISGIGVCAGTVGISSIFK